MCTDELVKCLGKTDAEIQETLKPLPDNAREWIQQDCVPANSSLDLKVPNGLRAIFDVIDNYVNCHTFENFTRLCLEIFLVKIKGVTLNYSKGKVSNVEAEIAAICSHFPYLDTLKITGLELSNSCFEMISKVIKMVSLNKNKAT